jgi:MATE family multidrug resistance protein
MQAAWNGFKREIRPSLKLAIPVVLAEIGWMTMGLVDTIMVGPLGPAAIGGVGLGNSLYIFIAVFGMGFLLGLDTLVSQAAGAGDRPDTWRSLVNGGWLAVLIAPAVWITIQIVTANLSRFGLAAEVEVRTHAYLRVMAWDVIPFFLFAVFRRYLQGIGKVRPVMVALLSANLINWLADYLLVQGHWGMPALGVVGAGIATVGSRIWMAGILVIAAFLDEPALWHVPRRPDFSRIRKLLGLGVPVAFQLSLEMAVFTIATVLAGTLGSKAIAAHQIALNLAGLTFMVPLGVSAAGGVRVGHAIGARDPHAAIRAGWTALALGAGFMCCAGMVFILIPRPLLIPFTTDPALLKLSATLLAIAAVFQLFDGLQVVATGILRGLGDTRTPMLANLLAHWGLGLPIAYILGITLNRGVVGLWIGLSVGLIAAGVILLGIWQYRTRRLRTHAHPAEEAAASVLEPL